jgi:phage shock protein A
MSIFKRISNFFRSEVNSALDNIEDAEKMLKQMVLDMEASINKATTAIAQAIANEKNLLRKMELAQQNSKDWENKAMQALNAGREDLARQALERKALEDKNLQELIPLHNQAAETSKKLREQLAQLKAKLDEAKNRQSTLIARSQAAKAQKQINKSLSGIGTDSFANFDKYSDVIPGSLVSQDRDFQGHRVHLREWRSESGGWHFNSRSCVFAIGVFIDGFVFIVLWCAGFGRNVFFGFSGFRRGGCITVVTLKNTRVKIEHCYT